MDNERIIPFTQRAGRGSGSGHGDEPPPADDELVEAGNAYAVARGTRQPATLRFLRQDGRLLFAMPYAFHPIIWLESDALLLLEYPGCFTVILAGAKLATLEARLSEYRVTWIRRCDPATAATLPVAVTCIERMHRYPSRELEVTASDN